MQTQFTRVKKAVFPVAGLGTRFLPATKANPKEMLPIVDKPLIQFAVEEAIKAGVTDLIFVTSSSKRAIEDHFDSHFELEHKLKAQAKNELLEEVQNIVPPGVSCIYVRQKEALGLGHAVLCAKEVVGDEPFAVILADDLISAPKSCLAQMVPLFLQEQSSVIAVQKITEEQTQSYGVVDCTEMKHALNRIQGIIEKPHPKDAPSLLGVVGRYILTPSIFKKLEQTKPGRSNEIQLTDAISNLLNDEKVFAYEFQGRRYDCGSKLGFLEAVVDYGLKHPETGAPFKAYLQELDVSFA